MKTLNEHANDYMDWRRSLNLSPKTIEKNKYGISFIIIWLEQKYHITHPDRINKDHLYEWQKHIAGLKNRDGHPLKPRTINTYNEGIKGFLTWLADKGQIPEIYPSLLRYVKKPITLPGSVLAHAAMRKLLNRIPTENPIGYRDRAMLELLYSTGVRAAELLGVHTFDIDIKNKVMMVTGKGNKQRMVPIGKTAIRHIDTYLRAIRPYLDKGANDHALFLNNQGKRLQYKSFLRCVQTHAKRTGNPHITPHTFRRSCTTELIRGGANMYHVKELLGHESLDTLKHYTRLTINDLKKTHEKCHPRERDTT